MAAFIWAWMLGTAHSDPLLIETDQALAVHLPTSGLNQIGTASGMFYHQQ